MHALGYYIRIEPDEWRTVRASRPLKRKDFIVEVNYNPNEIHDKAFAKTVVKRLSAATPLMRLLCNATSVPF